MAKNWSAYEAAKEIYGNNKENITEIGSRFPLFTRTVALADSVYILDILKAIPKTTARVVETGLKEMETEEPEMEVPQVDTNEVEEAKEETEDWDEESEEEQIYDTMTGQALYKLCCERGISSLCKSRKKADLIKLLEKLDNGEIEPSKGKAKATKEEKKVEPKKPKKVEEPEEDDWDDDEEEEKEDAYTGKTAKELFAMCKERGLKAEKKLKPEEYVKILKADDEKEEEIEDEEDDDDDWEI